MIKLYFEKTYNSERAREHVFFGVPFKRGALPEPRGAVIGTDGSAYPSDLRATARWSDGSVKWLFARCMVDLPKNAAIDYYFDTSKDDRGSFDPVKFDGRAVKTGGLIIMLSTEVNRIFDNIEYAGAALGGCISSPVLTDGCGNVYDFKISRWRVKENSPLCTVIRGEGAHTRGGRSYAAKIDLTFYAEKDWFEISHMLINTSADPLLIRSLSLTHTCTNAGTRCAVAVTNHETEYFTGENPRCEINAERLLYEANEHNAEVFYGSLFADCTDEDFGLSATVFQPHQNFPKALEADRRGFRAELVPDSSDGIVMQSGMARQQRLLFRFHRGENLKELNNRSIIYQMPDRPAISPRVFRESGVFEDVFCDKYDAETEIFLINKADDHARCYGMLNWGDSPNMGYTNQGRGGGELVWTNNEYDYPHACALMYARTGIRRYMDYLLVSARHQIDVDICHFSDDPLRLNGQWEHTNGHCKNGKIACSHQWIEGLLDLYHLSGDSDALDAAVGIGENVLRLLERPVFEKSGQSSARETGWALRTLTALYNETGDEKWLKKCDWIVGHFKAWKDEYGLWLSPYLENTAIRVVFMISVAACSLMRYYRVKPDPEINDMIISAVDDLIENARLDSGLFYYKELPSLKRNGNNPLILEALAAAYELTGDKKYLEAGIPTFKYVMSFKPSGYQGGKKTIVGDAVLCGTASTKSFAQMFVPFASFHAACVRAGIM